MPESQAVAPKRLGPVLGPAAPTADRPPADRRRPLRRPALRLSLQLADGSDRALLPRHRVARWVRAALERPAEITVRIVGAEEGQALNRDFRGKDYATNVLTFDYEREPAVVADLVLCAPVLRREAEAAGIGLEAHYAHLLVHGTLHAQGFDHEGDADAALMEARESRVLQALGFADPYHAAEELQPPLAAPQPQLQDLR